MKKIIQLLMVDDHPFILQAYKNTLNGFKKDEYEIITTDAVDGETGYNVIAKSAIDFDVAFLDISIPTYLEKGIESGVDLALLIREKMPNCKIFLLTMHTEKLKFKYFFDTIKPEGLVVKNDLTFEELIFAFEKVISGDNYLSETVIKMMEESNS
ncbi:DNA-binding NarL/FixJ family response regulator [Flavobacterium arsenatis]|uniref:DNA-binding NarL/FixJ family response regulator n=1 Tax=Flavobacterium arsenatis TaxID=1484332 RepID=A0ABU1TSV7_9FLAO|nr:response regulator [Flavobacterium arsenatis]MDR6968964.1 DNA-binding NarL/FixJ family response regulator [Flavobacterium arsenatis]